MNFTTKESRLFVILSAIFVMNALISEFIGVKIFSVEETLRISKFDINLFGVEGLSFNMSAGILTWPIIFVLTDIINEYYGVKQVRFLSILTAILIGFAFFAVAGSIWLPSSDFWSIRDLGDRTLNMDDAYSAIFGQGMWIIVGSITAFLVGQMADVLIFHRIKKLTGGRMLWLRATGSTVVSQLIDSYVVIFIAFYINPNYDWTWQMVAALGFVGYIYKFTVALLLTPILYVVHAILDKYLGKELAEKMIVEATKS
ncbi:queuosine precursor transporter [Pedobacter flavus]|uniref:Probable queuosine precursor transporter n=1 Tax=Pedobacter flavus TaxID=3113906 RepID=A0ABU7H2M7_9SPHI|nr:queuosine precursor transporter [Pedobacter sp. VNH31]MEE1885583.1 queuosine precursor transporter [Pedobacter sp. VNH31]